MNLAKIIKQKAKRLLTSLIGQAAGIWSIENICPYECSLADAMKDDVWEKLNTKEQETLKKQWRDYGGWCKHWCAKCHYKCVWREFEEQITQMKKSWSMVKGACSPIHNHDTNQPYRFDYDSKHDKILDEKRALLKEKSKRKKEHYHKDYDPKHKIKFHIDS